MITETRKSRIVSSSKAIAATSISSEKPRVSKIASISSREPIQNHPRKLKVLVPFMPHSILNLADPVENENGSEGEFQSGFGACNLR